MKDNSVQKLLAFNSLQKSCLLPQTFLLVAVQDSQGLKQHSTNPKVWTRGIKGTQLSMPAVFAAMWEEAVAGELL